MTRFLSFTLSIATSAATHSELGTHDFSCSGQVGQITFCPKFSLSAARTPLRAATARKLRAKARAKATMSVLPAALGCPTRCSRRQYFAAVAAALPSIFYSQRIPAPAFYAPSALHLELVTCYCFSSALHFTQDGYAPPVSVICWTSLPSAVIR
jgi:hypothetical protein